MGQFWPRGNQAVAQSGTTGITSAGASSTTGVSWWDYSLSFPTPFPAAPQLFNVVTGGGLLLSVQVLGLSATGISFRLIEHQNTIAPTILGWSAVYFP